MATSSRTDKRVLPMTGIWWASFDWARSPFYYVVVLYVFSAYFSEAVIEDSARGQAIFSSTVTVAGLAMALIAPFLGGFMDRTGLRWGTVRFAPPSQAIKEICRALCLGYRVVQHSAKTCDLTTPRQMAASLRLTQDCGQRLRQFMRHAAGHFAHCIHAGGVG